MKICCVGIAIQDRIFTVDKMPQTEGKYFATKLVEQGGGPAATAAVACARLGAEVDLIARVGDDSTGKGIIRELEQEKVNCRYMQVIKGATSTQATITVDSQGKRIIISYPSPNLICSLDFLDEIDFSQYDAVLADVRWIECAEKVFEKAKAAGVPTIMDADVHTSSIAKMVSLCDNTIFSEPGLQTFTQKHDITQALTKAQAQSKGFVCVTLGEDGYKFILNNQLKSEKSFKIHAVDTTGAGDVFHGAYAVAVALHLEREASLRFAAATAALKCTKPGGRSGIPTYAEVMTFLQQQG